MAAAGKAGSPPYAHPVHGESSLGRGSFLGARLPAEVEAMARGVRGLSQETFRRLLTAWPTFGVGTAQLATVQTAPEMCIDIDPERPAEKIVVSALEGKDCKESVRVIAESVDLSEEQLTSLISGMYTLLREALRLPVSTFKQEVFKEDLQELRIPEEFIMDFASVVFGNRRPVVEATTMKQGNKLPSVNDIKWRVDVAISTSSLARALQPSILMLLKLSDGTAHRFEVPVVKFQELRYNVALILKEMNDLEKRSILKIQD